jgi:predicted secreted protein
LRIVEKQPGKWTAWISGLRYHRYSTNDTSLCVVEDTQDAALVSLCKELTGREVHIPNPKKGWFESPFIVLDLSLTIVIPVDVS